MASRASDKRQRLVRAAADRFHRDGLQGPSIAQIAREADVPVGYVFYYFRTKDDLIRAVLDHWVQHIQSTRESLLPNETPRRRLEAFLDASAERAMKWRARSGTSSRRSFNAGSRTGTTANR